jgi:hypothetical protein
MSEPITMKIDADTPVFSAKALTRLIQVIQDDLAGKVMTERVAIRDPARFHDVGGGQIIGPQGVEVARVNVSELTADDALRAVRAVIACLEAEFRE